MEEKLSQTIYDSMRADILSGAISGNDFFSEKDIAKKYGVSKAPVKDALHLLCQEKYLISYPRRGYKVYIMSDKEFMQIREVREHIEKLAVKLAINRASDEEILTLAETISVPDEGLNPLKTNNMRFHARLAELSKNPYLEETLRKLLESTCRYGIQRRSLSEPHMAIIHALLERDLEKALVCLHKDLNPDD